MLLAFTLLALGSAPAAPAAGAPSAAPSAATAGATAGALADVPVTLTGSRASMVRQNAVARVSDLVFAMTPADVRAMVRDGVLVPVDASDACELAAQVGYPLARPEMRLFIERLAAEYRAATGERLVVTSLTRPVTRQPPNAHELSVHPAGMAVDLRVSRKAASRRWLESRLLELEERGLLDVTREYRPPHYHVALFPEAYLRHVDTLVGRYATRVHQTPALRPATPAPRPLHGPGLLTALVALPLMILVPPYRRRLLRRAPASDA